MASYINAVYYPSWRVYKDRPPSCLDVASITHIFYAFMGVNEDGTLQPIDDWADTQKDVDGCKGNLGALAQLKRTYPHLKTIVSVGGGTHSKEFPALAASEEARLTFAQQIRGFVDHHGLDGVDIDWEHPETPEAGADYLRLLSALRHALPAPGYMLTSALPTGEYCLRHIDLPAAAARLDLLNLMSYDFAGAWTDVSGHHAQLLPPPSQRPDDVYPTLRKSCQAGVAYVLARGVPAPRVLLGVPVYARHFCAARGPGQPFAAAGELDYCDLPPEWVAAARVDTAVAAASFVDADKGFVSFDVPATVRIKARYAKAMRLGGLFYWTGAGDRRGHESLVATGWHELCS